MMGRRCDPGWSRAPRSRRGAADGDSVDQQGRLSDAGGNGLTALAADADAFVERHVVADRLDAGEHRGTVADQGRTLDGGAELAVLDLVGFGAGEDALPVGNIDLAAADALGVDAVLRALYDCGRHEIGQASGGEKGWR